MAKKWPKDGGTAYFGDITGPFRDAIRFAYNIKRKNKDKDIPYKGLPKGRHELVSTFPVVESLSAEQLKYDLDEQGRDALTVILGNMCQIAFEQGRRIEWTYIKTYLDMMELSELATKRIREHMEPKDL